MSKLLIDCRPLIVLPPLVHLFSGNYTKALLLQQIHFMLQQPRSGIDHDGYHWVWFTYEQLCNDTFTWMTVSNLSKAIRSLEDDKYVVSVSRIVDRYSPQKYYRIDYDVLDKAQTTCNSCTHVCATDCTQEGTTDCTHINRTKTSTDTSFKDDRHAALFDRLAKEWLTVNPTQLTGHQALVDRYGFDNWLRGFDACSPKTRPNLAYVEKLVISNKLDEPAPKRRAVIVDSVTGEQIEVEI